MRGQYTAKGFDLFGCLRSAAYGLQRPTVDEIRLGGQVVTRPRRKLLPTGPGRDQRLQAMVEPLDRLRPAARTEWIVRGHAYFDGHPNTACWIRGCVIPHAESFGVRLSFPIYEDWMQNNGERKVAEYEARCRRQCAAKRPRRDDGRPFTVRTRLVKRPELMMLSRGLYPERYAPRTDLEEMQGVLVATRGDARISFGRTLGTRPRHGHTAHLRIGEKLWMSTDDREKLMLINAARRCPPGADAFVGGLGLGLIVLYLARRCKTITVAETEQDVIELVWPRLQDWCQEHHPHLKLRIFHGDALDAIAREPGRYDYVFQDIWPTVADQYRPIMKRTKAISKSTQPQAVIVCWAEELFNVK